VLAGLDVVDARSFRVGEGAHVAGHDNAMRRNGAATLPVRVASCRP
jgi:hypothetical protein